MSFILDALRKSDSERQQQAAPGIASAVQRTPRTRRIAWMPILIAVLALNALLFGWILMREDPATGTVANEPETRSLRKEAAQTNPAASTPTVPVAPVEAAREPADRAAARTPVTGGTAQTPPSDTPQTAVTPQPLAAEPPPDPAAVRSSIADSEALPSFEQLLVTGVVSSRPLHLDIHVYAAERDKRFVFVNMKKYREGEQLEEGPLLEEITETGIILSQRGNRFTLQGN